jgi:hypothetical protein
MYIFQTEVTSKTELDEVFGYVRYSGGTLGVVVRNFVMGVLE